MLRSPQWTAIARFAEAAQVYSGLQLPQALVSDLAQAVSVDQCMECLGQVPVDSASHKAAERALAVLMTTGAPEQVLVRALGAPATRGPTLRKLNDFPPGALAASESVLQAIANAVADADTGVATQAGKLLAKVALSSPSTLAQKVVACLLGVSEQANETFWLRAWELVAHLAVESSEAFPFCKPILVKLIDATFSPDLLLTLNAMQILHVLCSVDSGALMVTASPGFVSQLQTSLLDPLVGEEALRLSAVLAVHNHQVREFFLANVTNRLRVRGRESLVAVETFATLFAAAQPDLATDLIALWRTRLGEHVQTGAETDRVVALDSLARALRRGTQVEMAQIVAPDEVAPWLVVCLRSAHPRVRDAALVCVRCLVGQRLDWGVTLVLNDDKLVSQLQSMQSSSEEARTVVRAITNHPSAAASGPLQSRAKRLLVSDKPAAQLAEPQVLNL